jgi:putative flippase GtrA
VAEQHRDPGSAVKPHSIAERTMRYTVIGAICAVANNAVMILGGWAGGHYVPLSLLSFGIVTPFGYFLHARFTFKARLTLRDFFRFASGVVAGFPLYFLVMATLCSGLKLPVAIAAPITTITLYIWNYASAHWALRRRFPLG